MSKNHTGYTASVKHIPTSVTTAKKAWDRAIAEDTAESWGVAAVLIDKVIDAGIDPVWFSLLWHIARHNTGSGASGC